MSDPSTAALTFKPAATVVIFRHAADGGPAEVLMVQRAKEMRFAGGAAVFPGGRIDEADRALAAQVAPQADQDVVAAKVAAVRETLEETGLAIALDARVSADEVRQARALLLEQGELAPVLHRFGWTLDLAGLTPFARWCPQWDGAFDTRFFLADLGTGAVEIAVDATENTRLFWTSAANALAMADRSEISLIFPTRRNLERLAQFSTFAETRAHADVTPQGMISPSHEDRDGERYLVIPQGFGYPVTAQAMTTVKRG
ncbi:MAG: NUDIX domain-containing protein [Novosphingobium sp.]